MDKGSDWPIFKLKTDSVRIKINLLFAARWLFKGSKGFQKIAPENYFHSKKHPNLVHFQVQKDNTSTS